MPDLFDLLAARAANLPTTGPAVRPRLAHPFERARPAEAEPAPVRSRPTIDRGREPGPPGPSPRRAIPAGPDRNGIVPHASPTSPVEEVVRRHLVSETAISSVHRVLERLGRPESAAQLLTPGPWRAPAAEVVDRAPVAPDPAPADRPAVPAAPQQPYPVERAITAIARAEALPRRRGPESERVVQISIGRLEVVRGRTEPRRAPAPRPAPMVPLGEYLAGEAGDG